ncbi:hypothetical protein ACU4GA_10660 [Methylobacterium oryzae CBMB20]
MAPDVARRAARRSRARPRAGLRGAPRGASPDAPDRAGAPGARYPPPVLVRDYLPRNHNLPMYNEPPRVAPAW